MKSQVYLFLWTAICSLKCMFGELALPSIDGTAPSSYSNNTTIPANATYPLTEYFALYDLYYSANGPNWVWATNGPEDTTVPWNFSKIVNPCSEYWNGIRCSCKNLPNGITNCTTIELSLSFHNLTGYIPSTIDELTNLRVLDVSSNILTGSLPDTLGNLKYLETLSIHTNIINSTIPSTIANLMNLTVFESFQNRLHGTIPSWFGNIKGMRKFSIGANYFFGTIPNNLASWTLIEEFILAGNFLTGTVPKGLTTNFPKVKIFSIGRNNLTDELPRLSPQYSPQLVQINLQYNHFNGTIHETFGNFENLFILKIDHNELEGTLPQSLRNLSVLEQFWCSNNQLQGDLTNLFANKEDLRSVFIDDNQFTGQMFPANISQLTNLITYNAFNNFLSGNLPAIPIGAKFLSTLNLGGNLMTGEIPNWLSDEVSLTYLYLNYNSFYGTIPFQLGQTVKRLEVIYMEVNDLTGTIPLSISTLQSLKEFKAFTNHLTGSIPNIGATPWMYLTTLALNKNLLTGGLPLIPTNASLETIDVASNKITGIIPPSLFEIPSLTTVIFTDNCFSGPLPIEICQATGLLNLVMDGLGTGNGCQQKLFPGVPFFTAFTQPSTTRGNIPECIYGMPSLVSLYLSGDELTGTIPSNVNVSNTLTNIALSYNRLTGTIPLWMQQKTWITLDLSGNKLTGLIDSSIAMVPDDAYLGMSINRLSGTIPSSLLAAENITILQGNLFQCDIRRTNLPEHDPHLADFSCGSDSIDRSIYGWMVFLGIAIVLRIVILYRFSISFLHDSRDTNMMLNEKEFLTKDIFQWLESFKFHVSRARSYIFGMIQDAQDEWNCKNGPKVLNNGKIVISVSNSIAKMFELFDTVRYVFVVILLMILIVMMPMYGLLSVWYSMYVLTYAWSISAILLSGETSTIMLVVGFSATIFLVIYLFVTKVYKFSARKTLDQARSSSVSLSFKLSRVIQQSDLSLLALNQRVYRLSTLIVGFLNFLLMIMIDIVYVGLILTATPQVTVMIQIALSVIKVGWNEIALWRLYPRVKLQLSNYVFGNQRQENYNNTAHDHKHLMDRINQYQFNTDEINFMTFTVLLNNVVIPCFSIAVVSPHCYYNAFFADSPTASVSVYSCRLYRFRQQNNRELSECLTYDSYVYDTSYNAPFHYRYECSAAFSIKFAAVYIFMFILVGAVVPFITMCLQYIYHRYEDAEYDSPIAGVQQEEKRASVWETKLFQFADLLLPNRWKSLTPHPPADMGGFKLLSNDRLLVRFSSYLAILLSFGVLFPPLAVVTVVSVVFISYFEQFSISRLLSTAKALNYEWYEMKILEESHHMAEAWFDALKIILPFASFSYAFVVFDTLGDKHGWKIAVGPSIVVFVLPWCFYLWKEIWHFCGVKGNDANDEITQDVTLRSVHSRIENWLFGMKSTDNLQNCSVVEVELQGMARNRVDYSISKNQNDGINKTVVENPLRY